MFLVIGLGNPGNEYRLNRHNIGFMAVDEIMRAHSFAAEKKKFNALIAEGTIDGMRVLCLKPQTYMNESGNAASQAMGFYKIPLAQVIVIHDELDLAFAKLRLKIGGGAAGHNGLRSLDAHIGADYKRLRYGIGHPGHKDLVSNYVLNDFSKKECELADEQLSKIAKNFGLLLKGDEAGFLNKAKMEIEE